jgi:hypothetical protein
VTHRTEDGRSFTFGFRMFFAQFTMTLTTFDKGLEENFE